MNYQPVAAGNQPNSSAGIQDNLDACKVRKETVFTQQYVLLPLCTNRVNAASAPVTAVGPNSTNSYNAVGSSNNVVSLNFKIGGTSLSVDSSQYLDDPDMPALEDIIY
nr:hypothetical protein [Tanacetum cinerariifolium]